MENLKIINHILDSYKQAIEEQIEDNNKSKQNKMRSSKFIGLITIKFKNEFPEDNNYTVFSKEMVKDINFNRNEFLFDIHVCKVDKFKSVKDKTVKYIKESLIEIESEFAKDTSKVAIDFSKLVCGNSKLKIMIVSKCDKNDKFVESLGNIACNVNGNIYLVVLRHPSDWNIAAMKDYSVLSFIKNDWVNVNI